MYPIEYIKDIYFSKDPSLPSNPTNPTYPNTPGSGKIYLIILAIYLFL